jgi:hypothetical protein
LETEGVLIRNIYYFKIDLKHQTELHQTTSITAGSQKSLAALENSDIQLAVSDEVETNIRSPNGKDLQLNSVLQGRGI